MTRLMALRKDYHSLLFALASTLVTMKNLGVARGGLFWSAGMTTVTAPIAQVVVSKAGRDVVQFSIGPRGVDIEGPEVRDFVPYGEFDKLTPILNKIFG